ncbi:MAG: NUDIX domain-containing protein [Acinetobacter sp.]|jgi:ADP-ribose pyrophosphatase|nr:MAG: NUDIX domain-containing protein [Acinetobacter sp.]
MLKVQHYRPQFSMQDVDILQTEPRYRGFVQVDIVTLRHRLFASGQWNTPFQREIVRRRAAAGVLVHDPKLQKFLLIEQFRAATLNLTDTPWQLEIIAGLIDDGEDAPSCLKREALEEAGCSIDTPRFIYQYHPSGGASDEIFHFYVATADLSQCGGIHGESSEHEDIKVHIFEYADIATLLAQGIVRNAPVIIALQWLQFFLLQQKMGEI